MSTAKLLLQRRPSVIPVALGKKRRLKVDGWLTFILHEKIHDRGLDCIPRYNWSWWGAPVDATIGRKRTWELYRKHFTPEFTCRQNPISKFKKSMTSNPTSLLGLSSPLKFCPRLLSLVSILAGHSPKPPPLKLFPQSSWVRSMILGGDGTGTSTYFTRVLTCRFGSPANIKHGEVCWNEIDCNKRVWEHFTLLEYKINEMLHTRPPSQLCGSLFWMIVQLDPIHCEAYSSKLE